MQNSTIDLSNQKNERDTTVIMVVGKKKEVVLLQKKELKKTVPVNDEDPSIELPRDPTGSYLHLKLKRFGSIQDLSMNYAIQTWKNIPHDAAVDFAPSTRSKCKQCHHVIPKGELRAQLFLQCHKGCKNSAYFHGTECVWKYPETSKLQNVNEFRGWEDLPMKEKNYMQEQIRNMRETLASKKRSQTTRFEQTPTKKPRTRK